MKKRHRAHGPADMALRNTFIGSYMVRITIRHDGITQQLYVSQWSDTTRGVVQVQMIPGFPHTTYFADFTSNTAVIANLIERKARVGELNAVLLTDRLGSPGEGAQFAPSDRSTPSRPRTSLVSIARNICSWKAPTPCTCGSLTFRHRPLPKLPLGSR
ncbi:MAG: hypothetical protein IPH63_01495 [Flavobacteriales bacterium]|nr:hypothetical protein [Flavobacteriales bacterium]